MGNQGSWKCLRPRVRQTALLSVILFPLLAYAGVELTSSPSFCATCHEIAPAVESWKRSQHAPVGGEHKADCRDCHVPRWGNPVALLWDKLSRGVKDLYHHWASERRETFYFRAKQHALDRMNDDTCLSCHEDIRGTKDVIKTARGVFRGLHAAPETRKVSCTMCHKNTGHDAYD